MLMKVGRLGQSNRVLGDIVPAVFTPASLAPLMLLDGDADASSSVWLNAATKWPSAYQAVTASQPIVSAGVVEFDGTDDYVLGGYYTYGANTPQTLPDGAGSDAGKGITCTGLALDDESDSFWIANHGQATAVDPYTPSIMNVSKDGTTEISEIELISTFPSMQSIQGLAVDTSDSTLWFVSSAENLIRHITKAGADLGSISVDADPNGLAYDSSDDSLLVLYNNKQLKRYSASTGSLIETITTFSSLSNLDHLFLDEAMNILWISYGASGNTGRVSAYSIDDDVLSDPVRLPESDAIEGIYIDGTTLYVMNDGYFHNGTLNQLHRYSFDPSDIINEITRSYNALEFNMVFKIGGTSSSTEAIISLGNPLSGFGFGFFLVGNTDDTIRLIVDDGIAPLDTVDIVCSSAFTGFSVITIKADLTNRTISVYQNGVLQGQGTYDGAIKNTLTYDAFSLGALPDGTRSTHIDVKDLCVTDYLLSASQGNAIGNYYADEHGLIWTNMQCLHTICHQTRRRGIMKHYFVYVTFESEDQASSIANSAVQNRLAACANILSPHKSVYWWDGDIQSAQECAAVFKTTDDRFNALKTHIKEQHSYDVPCIVALPIDAGNEDFLSWINQETKQQGILIPLH